MVHALFVMMDLGGGGAELSLLELLKRLDRTQVEPSLFLLRRSGVHLDRIDVDMDVRFGCETGDRIGLHLPSILMKAVSCASRADVIVGSMEGMPTYIAWLAARLLRKPVIGTIRTDLDEHLLYSSRLSRSIARQIYPRCDAIVVLSSGSINSLLRVAQVPSARLHTILNPVDFASVRAWAMEDPPPGFKELGPKPYLLGIGRLRNAHKGFDLLIRAHALVRSRGIDHRLVILGEGPDRHVLEQLAQSLHMQDSLSMPGFERNPFPYLRNARALVVPSRFEAFGRIFLEAMALGVPIIASEASGPAQLLDGGKYGIIVNHEDVESLANAMASILIDDEMHARYRRLSLERSDEYSPIKPVRQWEELLCHDLIRQ